MNYVFENTDVNNNVLISNKILDLFMSHKRISKSHDNCAGTSCKNCRRTHFEKILKSVSKNEKILFVLPAFPGKSPNLDKVLGVRPDFAEKLSLTFLDFLTKKVKEIYSPGIKIILCSDGRVFSDLVGIKESDITLYQRDLKKMIDDLEFTDISLFNLDDFYKNLSFIQMRDELMKSFSESLEYLKFKVKSDKHLDVNLIYLGITRFLFEDSLYKKEIHSRAYLQKEAKRKAYDVIRRSNAWSSLIRELFPNAVRLSIHPKTCGSDKLGIRLVSNESWITAWHGVALETSKGFRLVKRSEAEDLGAKLVFDVNGQKSHYVLSEAIS